MTAPATVFQYSGIFKPQNARKTSFALVDKRGIFRGTADKIRTCDLQSRSLTLYPAELRAHIQLFTTVTNYGIINFSPKIMNKTGQLQGVL